MVVYLRASQTNKSEWAGGRKEGACTDIFKQPVL
jgi:hypothetical protein